MRHYHRKAVIDKQRFFSMVGYEPHEGEWAFHRSTARFRVNSCGWGWGKSRAAALDYLPLLCAPQVRGWIVAPSYDLGARTFSFFHDILTRIYGQSYFPECRFTHADMVIRFPSRQGGSIIEVKSEAYPKSLEAEDVDFLILDECSQMKRSTYERCYGRLRMGGEACLMFTPSGFDWTYDLLLRGLAGEEGWWGRRGPTWENPYIEPGFVEQARRDLTPEAFEARIEGKHRTSVGYVYPGFTPDVHVRDAFDLFGSAAQYGAVDFGFTNPLAALRIKVDASDRIYILDERYESHVPMDGHLDSMERMDGWGPDAFKLLACDPEGANERAMMRKRRYNAVPVVGEVLTGIELVRKRLEVRADGMPGLMVHSRCKNTVREFLAYKFPERKSERDNSENPLKANDHAMDALRLFVMWYDGKRKNADLRPTAGGKRVMTAPRLPRSV